MEPIINSLLDTDFYKFSMGQMVFHRHPDVPVKYAFTNRTKDVALAAFIREEDLRRELDHVRTLRLGAEELAYLRGIDVYGKGLFKNDYLEFLKSLELPPYELEFRGNEIRLEFASPWSRAIYWETFALSITNELYYRSLMTRSSAGPIWAPIEQVLVKVEGAIRLVEKIKKLRPRPNIIGPAPTHPDLPIPRIPVRVYHFSDFGTRRRFSKEWQDFVVKVLSIQLKERFRGTSNVWLAMKHDLMPMGTSAHELFQVYSGIYHRNDDEIRSSHNKVLEDWWNEYGWGLSIALTDTYGSDFFFRDFSPGAARAWKGLRCDSGDPIAFGEKAIAFYESLGIDPQEKMIVFSDGLDVAAMIRIAEHFAGRITVTFGWGTNLTNDLGFKPLSLVVKIVEANGRGTVKLSDNIAKAIGRPEDIERFKRIFGYTSTLNETCVY